LTTGYSRSPKLLKGALIELSQRFISYTPNVIVFQYNPETMTRTLEVWKQGGDESSADNKTSHTAQPFDPPESFTLTLELDAADDLENPAAHPVAFVSGVAARISAMEMLLYPQSDSKLGGLLGSVIGSLGIGGGASKPVPRGTVPVVLFAWGPGRIVPVRLTSFSVKELAYSPLLYPILAEVTLGLTILTPKDFPNCNRKLSEDLAITAFKHTLKQKEVLAAANVANSFESILSMLPF